MEFIYNYIFIIIVNFFACFKLFRYMKKYLLDVGGLRSGAKSIKVTGIEDEHIKDIANKTKG